MKNDITNGEIIRKWLDGELSHEEMEALKSSDAYDDYKKIIDATDNLNAPDYDIEKEYFKIQNLKSTKRSSVRQLKQWMYGAAAVLLVTLGYFYFANATTTYKTGFGEQLAISLPDNSHVRLNANSTLELKKRTWEEDRTIELTGEAFFEVEKGTPFIVKTNEGTVEVLGTKFNVSVQPDFFEVKCSEGKVKATKFGQDGEILTQGMGFRTTNGAVQKWSFNNGQPSWIQGESSFVDSPLTQVLIAFQNQYNVTFVTKDIDKNQHFSGSFTHDDINTALKTLFDAMEISYTFEEEQKIVLFKSE
ncbi:FecR family protein [uncultured Psychroserpens sp.]|uniref:FecR family protein n=1 Tax=uncultured Psychroserpens sp. TaxID=255436 RepID=UPI0026387819|nr:FecR domain-containing protein [uncultured Psychroserpens sp.]